MKINKKRFLIPVILLFTLSSLMGQDNQGEIQIYLFSSSGFPLENAWIETGGQRFVSDESGLINFTDYPGNQEYQIYYKDLLMARVALTIRQSMVSEALITLTPDSKQAIETIQEITGDIVFDDRPGQQVDPLLPKGTLMGRVSHIETGEPVSSATIIFRGIALEASTDEKGFFSIELPQGTYSMSLIHKNYSARTLDNLQVNPDEETALDIVLTPSALTLDAVTVFASTEVRVQGGEANLIDETKNSGVMLNLIGTEQMAKSGDSNAASALKRVTGLTILGGRYVYVRGMGERYSSSYLNGARLPSPEIDKRVVPLDLFPTSVLESLAIQKTYSPELYADFGGGSVSLRTAGIPDDRYKRRLRTIISGSAGYNMGSSLTTGLMDVSGKYDFLGLDDGHRGKPEILGEQQVTEGSGLFSGMSRREVADIGRELLPDWDGTTGIIPLDYSGSISLRDKIDYDSGAALGWNFSVLYKNSWDIKEESLTDYSSVDPSPALYYDYQSASTTHNIDIGCLYDAEFQFDRDNSIGITSLLVRTTDSNIQNYEGYFSSDSSDLNVYNISWVESTLFSQRLGGDFRLKNLQESDLNLNYTFSIANRHEPCSTSIIYVRDDNPDTEDEYQLYFRSNAAEMYFAEVQDRIHDGSAKIAIPYFFMHNASADFLDLGIQAMFQQRESDVRRFAYGPTSGTNLDLTQDPDDLFLKENIMNGLDFAEYTQETDNYRGTHSILAAYAQTDVILPLDIRLNTGLRVEYSNQEVETYYLFGNTQSSASLVNTNILPSVNFTIPLSDRGMQLRLGGSMTVNRPDLRELSDAPKFGVAGSGYFVGNPDLKQAEIIHGDLRWEYYITEMENLSLGIFYKNFSNAIELISIAGAAAGSTLSNVPSAYNIGAELEWRMSFRYLSDGIRLIMVKKRPGPALRKTLGNISGVFRDINLSGNYSWIRSQVDYQGDKGVNTSETRPLQGQSPWILNCSIGYRNSVSWSQDRKTHSSLNLNYNLSGPRISRIGTYGTPDYYQQPFHQLDLVAKHSFNEVFSIGLKVSNILDLPSIETVGDLEVNNQSSGRSITLSGKLDM